MDVDEEAAVGHKDQRPVQLAGRALDLGSEEPQCQPFLEEILFPPNEETGENVKTESDKNVDMGNKIYDKNSHKDLLERT